MKTLVKEQLTSHTGEEGMILCRKHLKMYSHCKKKEHMNLDFYQPIVIKINVFALNSCELKKKKVTSCHIIPKCMDSGFYPHLSLCFSFLKND